MAETEENQTMEANAEPVENKDGTKTPEKTENSESESRLLAALSYFYLLSVIIYVLKKEDDYIAFHARQGMVIFGIAIIGMFTVWMMLIGALIGLAAFIMVIIGALKAYKGEKYKFPFIGDIAEKITF